jgi:hypothetical protein
MARAFITMIFCLVSIGPASVHAQTTLTQQYGTRPAIPCPSIKHAPSAQDAALLIACVGESDDPSRGSVSRVTNATVEVGAPRAYTAGDPGTREADPSAPVTPIRGSYTTWLCNPISDYMKNAGKNCQSMDWSGTGICYRTPFGDWKCHLGGSNHTNSRSNLAGPQ